MRIRVDVSVEIKVTYRTTQDAARLLVERLCLAALEDAGLDPVSRGTTSSGGPPDA